MRTVKEISRITGISVRTLHYYDEIGLLKPTVCSEAGYRLYDDKALESLQQILFFKEFDVPLKEIKAIMENPEFDRTMILLSQKKMLELKRDRLNRLIRSIDDILKGENKMDFEVFSRNEIEELYQAMIANMSEKQIETFVEHYGDMEHFKKHFIENASKPDVQKNFQKVMEWYGGREEMMDAAKNPINSEIMQAYQNRIHSIYQRLAEKKDRNVKEFEVKALVGEYDFAAKQLYQMQDVKKLIIELADGYLHQEKLIAAMDAQYGEGASVFIGKAIKEFYME